MKLQAHQRWVGLVVALLGMSVVIQMTALWLATSDPSFAVVEDYEAKARDWDRTQAQAGRNLELGWTTELTTAPLPRGVALELSLTDRAGVPIDDARVRVVAFHNARAADRIALDLTPLGEGRYGAPLPASRAGLWELQVAVERGADRFTDVRRATLAPGS